MAPPHIPDTMFDLHSQRPLKAQLTAEVSAAASEGEASQIRAAFERKFTTLQTRHIITLTVLVLTVLPCRFVLYAQKRRKRLPFPPLL